MLVAHQRHRLARRTRPVAPPPPGDKRRAILDTFMKRQQFRGDALIEVLHKAQELHGYLDDATLLHVARSLRLPPSRVCGVATFYHHFTLRPPGAHTCVVCLGTACYVKGADQIMAAVGRAADISPGGTTQDRQLSLLAARCIGACGLAPAVVYDGAVAPRQTPAAALARIQPWLSPHGP